MIDIIDTIFIDTSVFKKEAFFKPTGRVAKLFDLAKQGYIRILLPIITEIEWLKHFQEATQLEFPDIERKLSIIGSSKRIDDFISRYSKLKEDLDFNDEIQSSFNRYIKGYGVERIDYSFFEDTITVVFEKYFRQERPFGSKGKSKEFPDAFVLAGLEKYAVENSIDKIIVFSVDNDFLEYRSDILKVVDIGKYLDDLVKNKIPTAHKEEQADDVSKLVNFILNCPLPFIQKIQDRVESYLTDHSRYSRHFNYADIDDVYLNNIQVEMLANDMEIIAINDNEIEASFFPKIHGNISLSIFNDEDSVWDSDNRDWILESYGDYSLEISSFITMTVKLDRRELDMGQGPGVELLDIDFSFLQDCIDEDIFLL